MPPARIEWDHSGHRLISWDERAEDGAKRAGLEAAPGSFSVLDLSTGRTTRGVGVVCTANCSSCGRRRPTLHGSGSLIAVADHDSLHIWESAKQQRVLRRRMPANLANVAFHPDGRCGLLMTEAGVGRLFDLSNGRDTTSFRVKDEFGEGRAFSPPERGRLIYRRTSSSRSRILRTADGAWLPLDTKTAEDAVWLTVSEPGAARSFLGLDD